MNPRIEADSARFLPRPLVAPAGHVGAGIAVASSRLPVLFSLTLFASAALLFVVEPMFARMVLPRLGGSPAVWNTCVMFFQAVMLAGYAYAHLSTRWLTLRQQVALHAALVLTVAIVHRIGVPAGWMPPVDSTPIPALLMLLLVAVGAPFFAVSATAPLLQKWFAQTNHPSARDPYFLYAASNIGSLLALLAYPFVIEPFWPLSDQGPGWSAGYAAVAILTIACAAAAVRHADPRRVSDAAGPEPSLNGQAPVSWTSRARWLVLSFVPSSLMLGVTTFLSTDLGSVPLLWIAPLTLYLLSFVVTFAAKPLFGPRAALVSMVALVPTLTLTMVLELTRPWYVLVPLHLATFFAVALVIHGQLARSRPSTRYLTEFYLWISVGGLIGGVTNTLLAPLAFTDVLEYPIALCLACALRPRGRTARDPRERWLDVLLPAALAGAVAMLLIGLRSSAASLAVAPLALGLVVALWIACSKAPVRFALAVATAIAAGQLTTDPDGQVIHAERTFFGVLRVRDSDHGTRRLYHGNTLHGEQAIETGRRLEPLSYYHRSGPIGQALQAMVSRLDDGKIAVVGLGAGALAAYARPGQQWMFYEIDPAVVRIARDPRYFSYLTDCGDACDTVLGDARQTLTRASGARYDAIVLDAFSSDAIPTHLLTRESMQLYFERLAEGGFLAVHISNRHLNLRPTLGALAHSLDLSARVQFFRSAAGPDAQPSEWVILARSEADLQPVAADARWERLTAGAATVWTDDYSNILAVLRR